jgi:hypothetical protein
MGCVIAHQNHNLSKKNIDSFKRLPSVKREVKQSAGFGLFQQRQFDTAFGVRAQEVFSGLITHAKGNRPRRTRPSQPAECLVN